MNPNERLAGDLTKVAGMALICGMEPRDVLATFFSIACGIAYAGEVGQSDAAEMFANEWTRTRGVAALADEVVARALGKKP